MAADCGNDRSFDLITARCLEYYRAPKGRGPMDIVREVMDDASFPMHNFAHHYLVPAVLMAEVCLRDGTPEAEFGKSSTRCAGARATCCPRSAASTEHAARRSAAASS